jgi:hypothetical protein
MQQADETNHRHCIPDNMVKIVSSRRGSNFLLHNLGENDVVFGTKGNGRNEVFLKVLERNSEQYIQLSKFQKMGLIQQIIREWKGNFYILNSKTNDLCLAKKNDHELSTTDPSARKLYTSVRRMMNYVNSKNQRQHQTPPPRQHETPTTAVPTTAVSSRTSSTSTKSIPQVRKERIKKENNNNKNKKRKTVPATSTNPGPTQNKRVITMNTTTAYINHDHHSILPRSDIGFPYSSASTNNNMNIAAPQRSRTMVTPEPSPRTIFSFLPPPTSSSSPFTRPDAHPSIGIPLPQDTSVLTPSSSSLPPSKETANAVSAKYRNFNNSTADNIIGNMEESAILALAYLASSSSTGF